MTTAATTTMTTDTTTNTTTNLIGNTAVAGTDGTVTLALVVVLGRVFLHNFEIKTFGGPFCPSYDFAPRSCLTDDDDDHR